MKKWQIILTLMIICIGGIIGTAATLDHIHLLEVARKDILPSNYILLVISMICAVAGGVATLMCASDLD